MVLELAHFKILKRIILNFHRSVLNHYWFAELTEGLSPLLSNHLACRGLPMIRTIAVIRGVR